MSGTQQASTVAVGPVQSTGCLKVLVGLLQGCKPDPLLPHLQVSGFLLYKTLCIHLYPSLYVLLTGLLYPLYLAIFAIYIINNSAYSTLVDFLFYDLLFCFSWLFV